MLNLNMATFKLFQVFVASATHGPLCKEGNLIKSSMCQLSLKLQKVNLKWHASSLLILISYGSEHMFSGKQWIPIEISHILLITTSALGAWKNILVGLAGVSYMWFLARLKTSGVHFKSHIKAIFENKSASPVKDPAAMAVIILGLAEMNCINQAVNQAEVRNLEFTLKDPLK